MVLNPFLTYDKPKLYIVNCLRMHLDTILDPLCLKDNSCSQHHNDLYSIPMHSFWALGGMRGVSRLLILLRIKFQRKITLEDLECALVWILSVPDVGSG